MSQIWEWSILVGFLFFATYTMVVIKKEKTTYLKEAKAFIFKDLKFQIPKWWSLSKNSENLTEFIRKDTKYDWKSCFLFLKDEEDLAIEELFKKNIEKLELLFDPGSGEIYNKEFFSSNQYVKNKEIEVVRIEGTGTEKQIKRVYFDAFLFKRPNQKEYYFCYSRSGVLNGGIEGPFFEEALLNFQIV